MPTIPVVDKEPVTLTLSPPAFIDSGLVPVIFDVFNSPPLPKSAVPFNFNEPVNWCISSAVLPHFVLPLVAITVSVKYSVINC